jgi:hypothetical protein
VRPARGTNRNRVFNRNQSGTADIQSAQAALRSRALSVDGRDDNRDRGGQLADLARRAIGTSVSAIRPSRELLHGISHGSIMVGKSYLTPGDEVRTVQSIENDEVVYRAACGASPTLIARIEDRKCSLAEFAAEVEGEVSPGV